MTQILVNSMSRCGSLAYIRDDGNQIEPTWKSVDRLLESLENPGNSSFQPQLHCEPRSQSEAKKQESVSAIDTYSSDGVWSSRAGKPEDRLGPPSR